MRTLSINEYNQIAGGSSDTFAAGLILTVIGLELIDPGPTYYEVITPVYYNDYYDCYDCDDVYHDHYYEYDIYY